MPRILWSTSMEIAFDIRGVRYVYQTSPYWISKARAVERRSGWKALALVKKNNYSWRKEGVCDME